MSVSRDTLWPPNHEYRTVVATPTATSLFVDDLTLKLRAEWSGTGTGRIHTMTWQATNGCGAVVTAVATVTVPRAGPGEQCFTSRSAANASCNPNHRSV